MPLINCKICEKLIVKYSMDIGDTACVMLYNNGVIDKKYICDTCAKEIARDLIDRS